MLGDYQNLAAARLSRDAACADLTALQQAGPQGLQDSLARCGQPRKVRDNPKLYKTIFQQLKQTKPKGTSVRVLNALANRDYKAQGGKYKEEAKSANKIRACQNNLTALEAMLRTLCEGKDDTTVETAVQAWKESAKELGKAERSAAPYVLGGLAFAGLIGVGLVLLKRRTRAARA